MFFIYLAYHTFLFLYCRLGDEEIQKRVDELRQELYKKMEKALENRREFILEVLTERR